VASLDVLVRLTPDVDPVGLRRLAVALTEVPGRVVAMLGGSAPHSLVVARSADLGDVDASAVARAIVAVTGGKAGGRADLAQGGGVAGSAAEVRDVVLRVLRAVSDRV
jgi:alanyl-tRNA synthetase